MNEHDMVTEFHKTYDVAISDKPILPVSSLRELRMDLLEEEYEEYKLGEVNNDLVEIADALADMLYIIHGTAITYGLPIVEIFNEVHASNMSKLGLDGKPIRRADGKILKGPNYFKPDIKKIIEAHR